MIVEPEEDGQVVNPADVHMVAEGFVEEEPTCTDWEIRENGELVWRALCAAWPDSAHIHLGDGEFLGTHAGRSDLMHSRSYVLRVRDGAEPGGDWVERPFRTTAAGPPGTNSGLPWTAPEGYGVEIVATGFQLPVNIAFVPEPGDGADDPFLYVAELYGTIKVVTRGGQVRDFATGLLNFNPFGNFPGSGEKGLAGLAVHEPTGDVYASMIYEGADDDGDPQTPPPHHGKVIRFETEDGLTPSDPVKGQTVLDLGPERQIAAHQVSNLTFGPDGMLYVHNGDGNRRERTDDVDSYFGKILRVEPDGGAPADNPYYDGEPIGPEDYVWAMGFRNPFGGAWRAADGSHYEVENGPTSDDRFAKVPAADTDAGRNFGWAQNDMTRHALYNWEFPHAPINVAFVEPETHAGSGFPEDRMDHAFVTESGPTWAAGPSRGNGKRITELIPGEDGTLAGSVPQAFAVYIGTGRATAAGLAAGPDGLYFTDLYKDHGIDMQATDRGANLLRVRYGAPPTDYVPPGPEPEPPPGDPPPPVVPPSLDPPLLDTVAPVVGRFGVRPRGGVLRLPALRRARGRARAAAAARRLTFVYSLSEEARVRLGIARLVRGRARGGRCRAARRGSRGRKCVRRVPAGALRRQGAAGANRIAFRGRLKRRLLPRGRYLATLVATDAAGNRSGPRRVRFRVVRRGRA